MKKYSLLVILLVFLSSNGISKAITYEDNYLCALDMLTLTSLIRLATLESEPDVKQEAIKHNTLWESITLSFMAEEETNLIKRKEKLKDNVQKRLAALLTENDAEDLVSGDFLISRIDSCLGDTTIQKVFNLYHVGIREYG
jgi:hypothetical protein